MTGTAAPAGQAQVLSGGLLETLAGQDPATTAAAVAALLVVILPLLTRAVRGRPARRPPPLRRSGRSDQATRTRPVVGDVWWAEIPFEDGTGSKDRPCVVVETHGYRCVVLSVTSTDKTGRPGWLAIPRQGWSPRAETSWLRTDRRIVLDGGLLRRYAGPCPPSVRKTLGL